MVHAVKAQTFSEKYPAVSFKLGELVQTIDCRAMGATPGNSSRSDAIKVIIARYHQVCTEAAPKLTKEAWQLCAEALTADILRTSHDASWSAGVRFVWASIDDEIRKNRLDKKFKLDGAALVEQVRSFTQAELLGFIDVLERSSISRSRGQAVVFPCDVEPAPAVPKKKRAKAGKNGG
jgi:hypothetical protein